MKVLVIVPQYLVICKNPAIWHIHAQIVVAEFYMQPYRQNDKQ